jgi:hypothetical protein
MNIASASCKLLMICSVAKFFFDMFHLPSLKYIHFPGQILTYKLDQDSGGRSDDEDLSQFSSNFLASEFRSSLVLYMPAPLISCRPSDL